MLKDLRKSIDNYKFKQRFRKRSRKLKKGRVTVGGIGHPPYSLFLFKQQSRNRKPPAFLIPQEVYVYLVTKGNFFKRFKTRRLR